jgi:hypothetical protein
LGFDPNAPYGAAVEDKMDLSEPMKKYMVTNVCQRLGVADGSVPALFDELGRYNLTGLEGKITCPLLSIAGEGEGALITAWGTTSTRS